MKKVLIVDDIETNRKVLKKMLELLSDYEVVEAVNGEDAIKVFKQENPDLILMDIDMPVMDGFRSTTEIKSISGEDYVPVIFITALSSDSTLGYALASGGDDFIGKPVNVEVLESKINVHLRIRELNQQLNNNNKNLTRINHQLAHEQELIEHFFESTLKRNFLDKKIIKYHMSSMSTFNGDVFLVERGPQGGLYIVMGDFSGHGLTAAMGTLPVAMIFSKMARKGTAISDMACEINNQLYELMPVSMFFAATLIEINPRCDIMSVWMGGVPESYLLAKTGEIKAVVQSQHMPLGILESDDFDHAVEIYNIEKGDKIYLYSDGVIESQNSAGEMFGSHRLKEVITAHDGDRFEKILNELNKFTDENDQSDDITLVEVSCCDVQAEKQGNEAKVCDFSWKMEFSFSSQDIREYDLASELSNIIGSLPVLKRYKGVLHVLLSEIYSNALEHSVLRLDSSAKENEEGFLAYYKEREKRLLSLQGVFIDFEFKFFLDGGQEFLQIKIRDSGDGYKEAPLFVCENGLHGRGLDIINGLCDSVIFSENGRSLQVVYRL